MDCDIIDQAQSLIKKVNPNIASLQRTSLGPVKNFQIVTGDFIQILHTCSSHWVCVSSIGCQLGVVNLFDSMIKNEISKDIYDQVCNLIGEEIFEKIQVINVHQQDNAYDCGLFAVAFATCLAFGIELNSVLFDVSLMRDHLIKCLKNDSIECFPVISYLK